MRKLAAGLLTPLLVIAAALPGQGAASAHHGLGLGFSTEVVSVADRTGPFPVDSRSWAWDNGLNSVHLQYRYWDCASANGCIMIWEDPNLPYNAFGETQLVFMSNGAFRGGNVRMNPNSMNNTAFQRSKSTCHEIGHGLGLNEHPAVNFNGSCMVQGLAPPITDVPDWHDFQVVNDQN